MADPATLSSRLSAARAVTAAQGGSAPASAATAPKAENASSTSTDPASSTAAATDGAATPASTASSPDQPETSTKPSGDDDTPKTAEDAKKLFVRLDKRERKIKKERRELNEQKAAIDKARQELIQENNRISALLRHGQEKHGWVVKGEQAWDNQDKVGFAKAIERMAKGASLAKITQWLAGAEEQPKAPQQSEEEQAWRREKADWERKQAEERAKAEGSKKDSANAAKREGARKTFASEFAKHPFLSNPDDPKKPDPDALKEAFGEWEEAMKRRKVGQTAHEVAKEVLDGLHARELRRLKRLGLEPKAATASKAPKNGEGKKEGERLPEPPPSNKNGKPPTLDDTRASRIAAAKRMTEQQRRGIVQ